MDKEINVLDVCVAVHGLYVLPIEGHPRTPLLIILSSFFPLFFFVLLIASQVAWRVSLDRRRQQFARGVGSPSRPLCDVNYVANYLFLWWVLLLGRWVDCVLDWIIRAADLVSFYLGSNEVPGAITASLPIFSIQQ